MNSHFYLPAPECPLDGPVPEDGVLPLRTVQSNWSDLDWLQPAQRPLSKLQLIDPETMKHNKLFSCHSWKVATAKGNKCFLQM